MKKKKTSIRSLIKSAREAVLLLMIVFCLYLMSVSVMESSASLSTTAKAFFMDSGYIDTGAINIVAAIYLDYRLLDSIFEASLLLVTIAGVLHISKYEDYID